MHIQAAGYTTFYAGKYLNAYGSPKVGGLAQHGRRAHRAALLLQLARDLLQLGVHHVLERRRGDVALAARGDAAP